MSRTGSSSTGTVDDPELQNRPRKDGDTIQTRSVQLSSERLRLTGKLDLVEEKDGSSYPVEYKRGDGPGGNNSRPDFWDNDAVQLCAQAMLLEDERSISIPFGVLYYIGSKRRVEVPFNDELRAKTLQAIRSIRELSLLDAPGAAADRAATSVFRLLPGNNLPAGRNALLPRTP